MKKLLIILGLLALAGATIADETYSFSAPTAWVDKIDLGRVQHNDNVCTGLGLSIGCSQSDACTAAGAAGGASCTAGQARAAECWLVPDSQEGREDFIGYLIIADAARDFEEEQQRRDRATIRAFCEASSANKDALCALAGLSAGCYACD
jgi:hypothetical protein